MWRARCQRFNPIRHHQNENRRGNLDPTMGNATSLKKNRSGLGQNMFIITVKIQYTVCVRFCISVRIKIGKINLEETREQVYN